MNNQEWIEISMGLEEKPKDNWLYGTNRNNAPDYDPDLCNNPNFKSEFWEWINLRACQDAWKEIRFFSFRTR